MELATTIKLLLIVPPGIIMSYFLLALIGTIIPRHRNFRPSANGIDLYLSTNGMHTDFILPIKNEIFDWAQIIDSQYYETTLEDNSHLGIGWGDKAVYLDIATWGELTFKMGLATLFLPTPTILHVTAYPTLPKTDIKISKTTISQNQYLQLCQFIMAYFKVGEHKKIQHIENAGYTANDNFYHAIGKYHALDTCNTWVNKGLKKIGVRTPLWTPLDKGIFYQFERIRPEK